MRKLSSLRFSNLDTCLGGHGLSYLAEFPVPFDFGISTSTLVSAREESGAHEAYDSDVYLI